MQKSIKLDYITLNLLSHWKELLIAILLDVSIII